MMRNYNRRQLCLGLVAMPALLRSAMAEEASTIVLGKQHGLPYLPLLVMEEFRLIENRAAKSGIAALKPQFQTLGGTSSLVDALLSGQMHFGVTGVPGLATLWDKTVGTPREVRALAAVQSMPFLLVTNNPSVQSIRDLGEGDKIALPAVKVSAQAIALQMAAAKEWGHAQYAKLDPLTITRSHPDAATAIMSKSTEINTHYAVAPYYQYELAVPGVRKILKSYDTFGGAATNGVMIMSKAFYDANPKSCAAVYAALDEANAFINRNPKDAAQIYISATNEKRSSLEELTGFVSDPDNVWTTTPSNSMKYVAFMHEVGTLKKLPASWKDLYLAEAGALAGS
jgi:NitT/TauT family transport system substrate-binding protein